MPLVKSKGNMYDWCITWNPLAGECPHKCLYCSTKSIHWVSVKDKYSGELRLDEKAMSKNLGKGKVWFVCAQNDLFANKVDDRIIDAIFHRCFQYPDNTYIFQTKNPERYLKLLSQGWHFPNSILGCTIESNRHYKNISCAPYISSRSFSMSKIKGKKFITIEPILDFDVKAFANIIKFIKPSFVNIGADSKKHCLLEPSSEKIKELMYELHMAGIEIRKKSNLERLMRD